MKKPVIFAINQLDKEMADFDKTFEQLRESFGGKVALVQYPVNAGTNFNAVVDVLKMKMYRWKPEGGQPEELDIPEAEKAKAAELHAALVEAAAENDESLMEKFFDQGSLPEEDIFVSIHKGLPYLLRLREDIPLVGSELTLAFVEDYEIGRASCRERV